MIKLALEVPTLYLKDFEKFQDFNFLIEPWLLEDSNYCDYFTDSVKVTYLDNGVNEYGWPATLEVLRSRARLIGATTIVAPDHPKEVKHHLACLAELKDGPFYSVGVLCDSYRWYWREIIQLADIVAIPYDVTEPRGELFDIIPADKPIHLLGFRSLNELVGLHGRIDSIDTGIPIRLALWGGTIEHYTIRHTDRRAHVTPKDYYNLKLTKEQHDLAIRNAAILRMVCSGHTIKESTQRADRGDF